VGESIVINGNVVITLINSSGQRARLGIVAPTDVTVHRGEVDEKIKREQQEDTR
jgi:carbon storage regulator